MAYLESIEHLYLVLAFVVPGLIVLFIRSQFVAGRRPSHSDALFSYLTVSVIYYALMLPFVDFVLSIDEPEYGKAVAWFVLVFVGPTVFGLLLGVVIQTNLI